MSRLSAFELLQLVATGRTALVLIADAPDVPTLAQAGEIARLCLELRDDGRTDIAFRYINSQEARRACLISEGASAPAIAIIRDGVMLELRGGIHCRGVLRKLLCRRSPNRVVEAEERLCAA